MQEHTPKRIRVSVLLFLLLLSLLSPYLIREYERRTAFQWEEIVQPRWEVVVEQPLPISELEDMASDDVAEWKEMPEQMQEIAPDVKMEARSSLPVAVKNPEKMEMPEKPTVPEKKSTQRKSAALHLNVPDDLYEGKTAKWEEKQPVSLPDFFASEPVSPGRVQLGGRIIIDEEKKQQQADTTYLDTVKGAEISISIKTP